MKINFIGEIICGKERLLKKGDKTALCNLKVGQSGKVLRLSLSKPEVRRHLLDMGITKGTIILIKKVAPMGDPVDIELRGYELCIRKEEMRNIDVEII